ncbi:spore germination protein GerPC [Metabacillus iocasae]|uniref:Spore germination protein PC n=1 Tax=Priestia iocasae TaxID=2291674 RepID=A0ABS2QTB7_9BACI|nr:spore germination protein GerPC [Metabacillus iocasae]MBM7702635.1 spore germination protein PC [Metabacillus iocasae]
MDHFQQLYQYVQQLGAYVQKQDERIQKLETELFDLQAKVKELEDTPRTSIEKIEYKFEQLKIDTLDGTLNIGLNPISPENIEDVIINGQQPTVTFPPETPASMADSPQVPGQNPSLQPLDRSKQIEIISTIHTDLTNELNEHGNELIGKILQERNLSIDHSYYNFIIEDIKKQLEQRIAFHLQQIDVAHLQQNESAVYEEIKHKMYEDIQKGIHAFLTYLPDSLKKGGGHS